jgi:hypothetical protein
MLDAIFQPVDVGPARRWAHVVTERVGQPGEPGCVVQSLAHPLDEDIDYGERIGAGPRTDPPRWPGQSGPSGHARPAPGLPPLPRQVTWAPARARVEAEADAPRPVGRTSDRSPMIEDVARAGVVWDRHTVVQGEGGEVSGDGAEAGPSDTSTSPAVRWWQRAPARTGMVIAGAAYGLFVATTSDNRDAPQWIVWATLAVTLTAASGAVFGYGLAQWPAVAEPGQVPFSTSAASTRYPHRRQRRNAGRRHDTHCGQR